MPTTWNVAATKAAIQAQIDNVLTLDGDTIQIAAGTVTIDDGTGQITCSKAIYLRGSGQGVTIIEDNLTKTSGTFDTIAILVTGIVAPKRFWMSDFTLLITATDPGIVGKGSIRIIGTGKVFRAFNITTDNPSNATFMIVTDGVYGVIDHITYPDAYDQPKLLFVKMTGASGFGDESWASPINPGSDEYMYMEDCTLTSGDGTTMRPGTDVDAGGRLVVRNNTLNKIWIASHGTDSSQRTRGARVIDIYDNLYECNGSTVEGLCWIRGGTGVFHNNTINGSLGGFQYFVKSLNLRDETSYDPFGRCNGTSPYDIDLGAGQYRCVDAPGTGTSDDLEGQNPPTDHQPVNNIQDPIYSWGNTNNTNYNPPAFGEVSGSTNVQLNRDYYVGTAKPGWSKYTYPHPWTEIGFNDAEGGGTIVLMGQVMT